MCCIGFCFFFSSRRRHTRLQGDWSSDVCSSDLLAYDFPGVQAERVRWRENAKAVLFGVGLSLLTLLAVVLAALSRTIRRLFIRNRQNGRGSGRGKGENSGGAVSL